MVEPKCPGCNSPEINPDPQGADGEWHCGNCERRFDYEDAFIHLREAVDFLTQMETEPMFPVRPRTRDARAEPCRRPALCSQPLQRSGGAARRARSSDGQWGHRVPPQGAALRAYLFPGASPHPVLGVDPGVSAVVIGPRLALSQDPGEDPIAYTVRWLERAVGAANDLLAGRLHAALPGRPEVASAPDGPRSHRQAPGPAPRRRFVAVAYWLLDSTLGETFEAEGTSISGVLADVSEQIEAHDFHPDHFLGVGVMWKDNVSADEEPTE